MKIVEIITEAPNLGPTSTTAGGLIVPQSAVSSATTTTPVATSTQPAQGLRNKKWLRGAARLRKGYRQAADSLPGQIAGAAVGGAATGIARGLKQVSQGAGDPLGLGGYQDYSKNATR